MKINKRLHFMAFSLVSMMLFINGTCQDNIDKQIANAWKAADDIAARIKAPVFPDKDYKITDFGAKADGKTLCTEAINRAIETCSNAGGGRVVVPVGEFLTGAIILKSNVNLHISEGAVLKFSQNENDYLPLILTRFEGVECMNYRPFIYAYEQINVAITGTGTIDGQATDEVWWPWKGKKEHGWKEGTPNQKNNVKKLNQMAEDSVPVDQRVFGKGFYLRPNFVQPYKCKNVLIEGITIIRSPMWELNPVLCTNVIVRNVNINSHGPNNDGCDPESCTDVLIEGCTFDTGDDCIAIKSGRNADGRRINVPCENLIVRNCNMKDGHGGVVIGSEISGSVRNVFIENCTMNSPNLDRGLRIKTNSIRGGVLENIYMRNVKIGEVAEAIVHITFMYEECDAGKFTPIVRNVYVQNVTSTKSKYALFMEGYERSPISNVYIKDCSFDGVTSPLINELTYVENLKLENVKINGVLQK